MSEESRKVALVTGASRGIGAAIAGVLADAGLLSRNSNLRTGGRQNQRSLVIKRRSRACAQCHRCNQRRCFVGRHQG